MTPTRSIVLAVCPWLIASAFAQTPGTAFTYQGRLSDAGSPANGSHDLRFSLWVDAAESDPDIARLGLPLCKDDVAVNDGLFTVQLDFGPNAFSGFPLWLQIEARSDDTPGNCASGSYTPLSPRQPLTPTPYSVYAATAGTAGLKFPYTGSANIGNGALLTLENTRTAGTSHTGIFWNRSTGDNSRAISGISQAATGLTFGLYGQTNSNAGVGVHGESFGLAGVRGIANNSSLITGYGGYFESAAGNGFGVFGYATSNAANWGVYGRTDSPFGTAVHGYASANTGATIGVYARCDGTSSRAVFGEAMASSGTTYGGRFHNFSTSGTGLYASAGAATGTTYGVYGRSHSPSGYGVYGHGAAKGVGVYGIASGGDLFNSSIAVFGEIENGDEFFSYAGYFLGKVLVYDDLVVAGNLDVNGTKSFKIDHPTDPANKYLVHYCSEAPEPLNTYRGNVVLDAAGRAVVDLPEYFAAVNRDPSYTLTPIGAAAPNLHIARELDGNRFEIAGGHADQKISWRVEATRNDPWVRAHGSPIEVDKPDHERGKYRHPELYGQPAELGIDYQRNADRRRMRAEQGE